MLVGPQNQQVIQDRWGLKEKKTNPLRMQVSQDGLYEWRVSWVWILQGELTYILGSSS